MSLNTSLSRSATLTSRYSYWQLLLAFSLVAWLSGSLLLDVVIMPTMYATGMMTSPDFATAGYSMFWVFNRLEILCAAIALIGAIGWHQSGQVTTGLRAILFTAVMMTIAIVSTYYFTPAMSALSLNLSGFGSAEGVPVAMNWMHGGYFSLECLKLVLGISLGMMCWRQEAIAIVKPTTIA